MPVSVMPAVLAGRLREADLTYREVGATAGVLPSGYHHLHRCTVIGSGHRVFAPTADALVGWQVHSRADLSVSASSATAEPGQRADTQPGRGGDQTPRALPDRLRDR
jgi:uncharacterized protein (UPF0548 family)